MHIILLILALFPIIYKVSFWLYTIQLKEYRWDRFKEYLTTAQWKKAMVNFFSIWEIPLLFMTFLILIKPLFFEGIVTYVMFYFLLIYSIFVLGKVFRKGILHPKLTSRMIILIITILIWFWFDIFFLTTGLYIWTYTYIMFVLIFTPVLIFFCNFLISPLVNYKKNKLISSAIFKSKTVKKPIKIGITWSYGKTSIKEYLSQILESNWTTLKTPENINTELWVSALVLSRLNESYKYFVAEMWAYKIWEIETLWEIVNHKYWFLTAIWNQHLWLFWSIENTKKGKFEIANKVIQNKWVLYVNWNNIHINDFIEKNITWSLKWLKYTKYGIWHDKLDAFSNEIDIKNWKTKFNFNYKGKSYKFKTNLIGSHNIINLTWILAFCFDVWFSYDDLKTLLTEMKSPKNTLELIKKDKLTLIDDTYNISEEWLFAWIEVLNSFKWEKILVIDDILELWSDAEKIHEEIWEKIWKNSLVDKVILVWINYSSSLKKWLLKSKFKEKDILKNLNKTDKTSTILFEGRKTKKYLEKFTK